MIFKYPLTYIILEGGVDIFDKRYYGKINDHTISDMYKYIDYTDGHLEDRLDNIEKSMEVGFFQEYFDNTYDPHPTKKGVLAENDSVCQCLERMADYILSCDEEIARKKAEKEYIYFNDRNHLNRKLDKELSFGSMLPESKTFQDVILNNILEDDIGRISLPKDVEVTEEDINSEGLMGECLQEYGYLLKKIDRDINNGGNRKRLSLQKFHIRKDMETIKRCFMGLDEYQHDNINKITQISKDFDLSDKSVVYGFTTKIHGKSHFVQGLIFYNKPKGLDINDPLSIALHDIDNCLNTSGCITPRDRRLIYLLRQGISRKAIGKILGIDESMVTRDIHRITKTITEGC